MDDWHRCPSSKIKISEKQTEVWSDLDLRKKLSENQRKDLVAVAVPVSEDDNHVCKDCGAKAKFWFKTNDRYCCSDRIERCPIVRDEISERTFNLWIDEEFRQKMKDAQIYDEKRCLNVSLAQKKWYTDNPDKKYERAKGLIQFVKDHAGESLEEKFGEEKGKRIRQKASERVKGKTWVELYGKVKAEEMKSKQSSRLLNKTIVELYGAERASQISLLMSIKKTEHWKNPEYAKKISSTFKHGMNKPEKIINEIIEKLGYIFVGNFDRMINGKNPDFINDNKKKIIEHFGIWYHGERYRSSEYNDFSTNEEHEQQRIDHFAKEGYKCLIIWEDELKDIEKLIEKILKFDME
jgi:G:T-mismatch repair DNA endonuclease (very short patch repair protein)